MNKNILKTHLEILDRTRQELLVKLLPFTGEFILGGGTALALQLNHRKSFDFDFFSSAPINKNLLEELSRSIPIINISVDTTGELTFFTKEDIKITFLYYPFSHAFPIETLDNGLKLFSAKDIAIQKAYTIGRRGEYRDYFDLYIILKERYMNFVDIISWAKKIYGGAFEKKLLLQQLVYFGDLLNLDIVPASSHFLPKPQEVKNFFEDLVKKDLIP